MDTKNDIKELGFHHIPVKIVYNGLAGNAVRRYHASLTSYFILIPVYHVVWIVGQSFQAGIIQPQDLD